MPGDLVLLVLVVAAILIGLVARGKVHPRPAIPKSRPTPPPPTVTSFPEVFPYQKKWYLLSKAERAFYEVLRTAAGDGLYVFPKVRLLDLLWVPDTTPQRFMHLTRVMSKHVDFVLCDRHTVAPVLVVELDDASHELPGRAERDAFVDAVLRSTGLPVLRVRARRSYTVAEVAELLRKEIGAAGSREGSGAV